MTKIVSIHSFRGGTGKSNTTANLSALLGAMGKRVGVVDTDIQSPGIHVLFNVGEDDIKYSLNNYLWGQCSIVQTAMDVTKRLGASIKGQIFLVPSSIKTNEIAKVLREGYDVGLLSDGFKELGHALKLDYLMIDTHPGLNEETLLSMAASDALCLVMRPDQQDFQGTAVTVDVARKLDVPNLLMLVNKVPQVYDFNRVRQQVQERYGVEVAAVLPHSDEMMALASAGIFVLKYPNHTVTQSLQAVAERLNRI